MRRKQLLMIVLAIVIVGVAISTLFAKQEKVTLCHRPPGNPANAHTLTVGAPAASAHFAHGDTAGPCPVSPSR